MSCTGITMETSGYKCMGLSLCSQQNRMQACTGTLWNYDYQSHSNVYTEKYGFPSFPGVVNEVQVTLLQYKYMGI